MELCKLNHRAVVYDELDEYDDLVDCPVCELHELEKYRDGKNLEYNLESLHHQVEDLEKRKTKLWRDVEDLTQLAEKFDKLLMGQLVTEMEKLVPVQKDTTPAHPDSPGLE